MDLGQLDRSRQINFDKYMAYLNRHGIVQNAYTENLNHKVLSKVTKKAIQLFGASSNDKESTKIKIISDI